VLLLDAYQPAFAEIYFY